MWISYDLGTAPISARSNAIFVTRAICEEIKVENAESLFKAPLGEPASAGVAPSWSRSLSHRAAGVVAVVHVGRESQPESP